VSSPALRADRRPGADESFTGAVSTWWASARTARDDLPWRATRDGWAVLVSELMLAQTQVVRVAERFGAFLERFPTPRSCASAELGDVVRAWSGLGYNRRALALHRAAHAIVERHGGSVPFELDDLLALPGVGPYTARAVRAFAYDAGGGVVDVNIARVVSRAVVGRVLAPSEAQATADRLAEGHSPREWNLALMDFGSLVCRARAPRCGSCPAAEGCRWRASGDDDPGAARSRQSPFAGSDRQGRGRILKFACSEEIPIDDVAGVAGWPDDPDRAALVAGALVREGLLVLCDGRYKLSE
jgi:A/G-specific adenine glycosylase